MEFKGVPRQAFQQLLASAKKQNGVVTLKQLEAYDSFLSKFEAQYEYRRFYVCSTCGGHVEGGGMCFPCMHARDMEEHWKREFEPYEED